ncbi:hypothetical protein PIB30_024290 [Stylosanthes scabra]|uniref:Reverse transcriptase domain-containing protein n=1 Tax=Stylosanthes scabra TaxID=79078 RepID=A0ABU6WAT7_9FABA|nr:hypothetical protein [Stylosanthes scabra]
MPRALVCKPPPMVATDDRSQSLVIPVVTINTMIRRVFVDEGISSDILFRRCFDAPGLTKKDLKAHSDDLFRCLGKRLTQIASLLCGRPTMYKVGTIMTTSIHTRKFITDDDEVEVLRGA